MIQIHALAPSTAEIRIFDPIGKNWMGEGLTAKRFDDELKALGQLSEITIRINSPGGEVFDGIAIYNALKGHTARKVVVVEGLAASIASIIAMAGDTIRMSEGAMVMVHNPWMLAAGDAEDLRTAASQLDQVGEQLVSIYSRRTGQTPKRVRELMDVETWLSADEAADLGFADETMTEPAQPLTAASAAALSKFTRTPAKVYAMTTPTTDPAIQAAMNAERRRVTQIRSMFSTKIAKPHAELFSECLADPECTPERASQLLLAKVGEGVEPCGGFRAEPAGDFLAAAADALCMRAGIAVEKPHAAARDLAHTSTLEMARTCLSQAGRSHRGLPPIKLISAALTTSDFPGLLENALGKALRAGYENDPQSHAVWVKNTRVPDFKTQSRLLLGSAPALATVLEGGEYTYGSPSENKTTLAVTKYGKAMRLTWETLVNDDLGAFMSLPQSMGAAARRKEADSVYEIFSANSGAGQTMQDTVTLFHADHANLSATTGAISVTTLGAARTLLRKQQALGNGGYLNLAPRFLIVPAESETLAEQVLASATRHRDSTAVTVSSTTTKRGTDTATPEWISRLQLVVEPRLNAAYGFYLAAHYSQIDTVELATLEADGGAPVIEEEREFNVDAQAYKVRHVFVAKAIDWKGMVRVPTT